MLLHKLTLKPQELLALALPSMLASCYPDPLAISETDVVVTVRDQGRNYAKLKTYALADQVFDLCKLLSGIGEGGAAGASQNQSPDCREVDHDFDDVILSTIQANMDGLGFEQVERDEAPDIVILPGVIAQDNWYVWYPYCDYWYYPYCYYYPWAPTATNYPIGTLVMYGVVPGEADQDAGKMPVAWAGIVRGILSSSQSTNEVRLVADINQAFAQSKYLGEGK